MARGTLSKLSTFLSQLKGGPFEEKQVFEKSHNAEKLKEETLWGFQHLFCRKTAKKLKGDPLGNKLFRKTSQCRKKIEKGDPLIYPGMVRGKTGKTFLVEFARANGAIL